MALAESRSSESGWDLTPASYLTFRILLGKARGPSLYNPG